VKLGLRTALSSKLSEQNPKPRHSNSFPFTIQRLSRLKPSIKLNVTNRSKLWKNNWTTSASI
jgi:hypothetical protein